VWTFNLKTVRVYTAEGVWKAKVWTGHPHCHHSQSAP
jgi:hypothetical protein